MSNLFQHQAHQYVGAERNLIREVSYWVVMPLLVVVGLAINTLALHLLQKPRIRDLPATASLRLLLGVDVTFLVLSVTTIATLDGAHLYSYTTALYFAHVFFIILNVLQTFSHYIIAWISCSRFVAIWYPHHFQKMQQPWVMRLSMTLIGLLCCGLNFRRLLHMEVTCVTSERATVKLNQTEGCEGGSLFLHDNYLEGEEWLNLRLWIRTVLTLIIPGLLVLVSGLSIVVGLVRRHLRNSSANPHTRDQTCSAIYITVCLSLIFVITITTNGIYCYVYSSNLENSVWSVNQEVFRVALNLLLLGEHVTHILLALSQAFRDELWTLLRAAQNSLYNTFVRITQTSSPSCRARPVTHNILAASNTTIYVTDSIRVPHLTESALYKQSDEETR